MDRCLALDMGEKCIAACVCDEDCKYVRGGKYEMEEAGTPQEKAELLLDALGRATRDMEQHGEDLLFLFAGRSGKADSCALESIDFANELKLLEDGPLLDALKTRAAEWKLRMRANDRDEASEQR